MQPEFNFDIEIEINNRREPSEPFSEIECFDAFATAVSYFEGGFGGPTVREFYEELTGFKVTGVHDLRFEKVRTRDTRDTI